MSEPQGRLLVATDLDGCLLDESTYVFEAARPALEALAARGVPLVLATSKTRAETEPLSEALGGVAALVVENGGALLVPAGLLEHAPAGAACVRGWWTMTLGRPRQELVGELRAILCEAEAGGRSFADLDVAEVQRLTGLAPDEARRAMAREYDEPFLLDDDRHAEAVTAAAQARGLRVTRGGRFWHLTGDNDKGRALFTLLGLWGAEGCRWSVIALGNSPNDLALLRATHRPIVVPRAGARPDPALAAALPRAERAPGPGPAGWSAALLSVLKGERLPLVGRDGA